VVLGIDTGLKLDYVIGDKHGVFYQDDCEEYKTLDGYMDRWKKMIAVIDAGGDLIGSRAFAARWPGRVFLCYLGGDKKNNEIFKWGKKDEHGAVHVDRNRAIQLVVDEFRTARIPVHGTEEDWYEYWLDWNNLSKLEDNWIQETNDNTKDTSGYDQVRSPRLSDCILESRHE